MPDLYKFLSSLIGFLSVKLCPSSTPTLDNERWYFFSDAFDFAKLCVIYSNLLLIFFSIFLDVSWSLIISFLRVWLLLSNAIIFSFKLLIYTCSVTNYLSCYCCYWMIVCCSLLACCNCWCLYDSYCSCCW